MAGRKKADPIDQLGKDLAADHTTAKNMGTVATTDTSTEQAEPAPQADPVEPVDTTATETPPAIETEEEVADAAWQARLDRLVRIVEESDFDGATAVGDVRDCLRELFKTRDKPWHLLDANMRKDLDNSLTKVAQLVIRKVVLVVAEEESVSLQGTMLDALNVKSETLEVKIKIDHVDKETLLDAFNLAGQKVVIVSASDKRFGGARRPNDPGEMQEDLKFSDPPAIAEEKPTTTPPSDDSDLAGEEPAAPLSDLEGVETHDPDAAEWIVYDSEAQVWLAAASEDDPWTEDPRKAMLFALQEAKDECVSHGEGVIVQRHPDADKQEGDAAM